MVEVKNNKEKKTPNTSKVRKVSSKKNKDLDLSSDDLYEVIKNKKKNSEKSNKKKSEVSKEKNVDSSKFSSFDGEKSFNNDENNEDTSKISKEIDFSVEKDDLIITREIIFSEDKLDLKDNKILEELRDAIKEFDALNDTGDIVKYDESEFNDDDLIFSSFNNKEKNNNNFFELLFEFVKNKWKVLIFGGIFLLFLFYYFF